MTDAAPSPARILVVDDNPDAAESLAIVLQLEGYRVDTAHGGAQALTTAAATHPAAVLLDLTLPDLDGYEVARRIRQHEAAGDPRVLLVAISGYGGPEDLKAARAAGFDAHFLKPVPPESILELLTARLAGATGGSLPGT